ncbi:hypothetical protein [Streptococcus suis]|uniref:hypothetical protein n=1 Tax=Streptococcus suis TaxID=1307 RepID=UPI000CF3CE54|nr:hypothetical protein [Streptococcus suis]
MISYKRSFVLPLVISMVFILIGMGLMLKPEPAILSGLGYLLLAVPSAFYAYLWRKQGPVFVLNQQCLEYKNKLLGERITIPVAEIGKIQYELVRIYRDYYSKRLRIVGRTGTLLAEVKLENLSGADFNEVYQFLSPLAPHIVWEFPK